MRVAFITFTTGVITNREFSSNRRTILNFLVKLEVSFLVFGYPDVESHAQSLPLTHSCQQGICRSIKHSPIEINMFTAGIRLLLSSYTKAIQRQESFTGNLFQQKTKSKCVMSIPPWHLTK